MTVELSLQITEVTTTARIVVVLGSLLISTILGGVITYRAYQGYRRNQSQPMLYLAIGLVLVTVVPPFISLILSNLTEFPGWIVVSLMSLSQICGLISILYSLYGKFDRQSKQIGQTE